MSWELSHPSIASRAGHIEGLQAEASRSRLVAARPRTQRPGILARIANGWKNRERRIVELSPKPSRPQDA